MPFVGAAAHRGTQYYSAAVTSGVAYSVTVVGLSAVANVAVFNDRAFTLQVCATGSANSRLSSSKSSGSAKSCARDDQHRS